MPPHCNHCGNTDTEQHPCGCDKGLVPPKITAHVEDNRVTVFITDNTGDEYRLEVAPTPNSELSLGKIRQPLVHLTMTYADDSVLELESMGLIKTVERVS